jgi:hypothetical protein
MQILRKVAILVVIASCCFTPAASSQEVPRFSEEIDVVRIITEVRVVDSRGDPILGLEPGDFTAEVGGVEVEVEAADWIAGPMSPAPLVEIPGLPPGEPELERLPAIPDSGRLIIILFQTDFASVRLTGLFRMSHYAQEFIKSLAPEDRAALVVFGSHLQIHSDFTNDFDALSELLTVPALLRSEQRTEQLSLPSLAAHFDVEAARDAANISQALEVLGTSLQPISGPKSVVFFG